MLEFGVSRQDAEAELREMAQILAPYTGNLPRPSVQNLIKHPPKRGLLAKESPHTQVVPLLKLYSVGEKRLILNFTKKKDAIQAGLQKGLEDLKAWAKEQRGKGKSRSEISRQGDKKLQILKLKTDKKLQGLKKESNKAFDALEKSYTKKHPEFEGALQSPLKFASLGRIAGKVFIGMAISFLVLVLVGLTINFLLGGILTSVMAGVGQGVAQGTVQSIGAGLSGLGKAVIIP